MGVQIQHKPGLPTNGGENSLKMIGIVHRETIENCLVGVAGVLLSMEDDVHPTDAVECIKTA